MRPIDRFIGGATSPALLQALTEQYIVHGNEALATALAAVVKVEEHVPGTLLIEQGAADNDLIFILIGEVVIAINGQEIAYRKAGQQVGEMALLSVGALRSASVITRDTVVTARVTEADFSEAAAAHPETWRRIAAELGDRLRQRTRFIRQRNVTPILFVGSSRESLPIIQALLDGWKSAPFVVRAWTGGVFTPSQFPIDDLTKQLDECDYSALVLGPDDQILSRGITSNAPRDNVLFELGLFMGAIARSRTFFIVPADVDVKIPTDILGLNPLRFVSTNSALADNVAPVCREIAALIERMGPR
jgi:CRP/FNR family transcriptional regulator, cyclic AMP receptor protein